MTKALQEFFTHAMPAPALPPLMMQALKKVTGDGNVVSIAHTHTHTHTERERERGVRV